MYPIIPLSTTRRSTTPLDDNQSPSTNELMLPHAYERLYMASSRLRLALLLCLTVGLAVAAAPAAAGTPNYDPANPWYGMTVTASHGEITAGETYDLRRADELSGDEIQGSQFVEELRANDDGEIRIDTTDLDPGYNYFITGPGLASRGSVTASETFELRGQELEAGFDDDADDAAENESDDTDPVDDEADSTDNDSDSTTNDTDPTDDTEPARYYGTVTINGEPAPTGTTIEAEVDGEVRGSITVETAGSYGGPEPSDEQLTLAGAPASENTTISFYVTSPDGDRLAAGQTDTWEPATLSELALTVEHTVDTDADPGESTTNATEPTTNDSETAVTDTAPGFGVVVAVVALLGVAGLRRRQSG